MPKQDNLTLKEVCQEIGKSKRTITRYIKKGILNPEKVKSENGILEYRFNPLEIEKIKNPDNKTSQTTGHNQKVDLKNEDILSLVKVLQKQLKSKDQQIKKLLDRQRETNYLMGQLHSRILLLEDKTKGKRQDKTHRTEDMTGDKPGDRIKSFFGRWFKMQ
jgi:DNA-binding transcriptional MerR regulator